MAAATASIPLLGHVLHRIAVLLAYAGGIIISGVGIMSAVSIVGRSAFSHPILGDFELVEFGIAVAGACFLPYCQSTRSNIVVDFFTRTASPRAIERLDRLGALLLAVMFLAIGWRTFAGSIDILRSGESTMLMGLPVWLGYALMVPGVVVAGVIALAQAAGIETSNVAIQAGEI
jgi:TRAP-type C4-dicarboxylate transport system permease small subunit